MCVDDVGIAQLGSDNQIDAQGLQRKVIRLGAVELIPWLVAAGDFRRIARFTEAMNLGFDVPL